MFSHLSPPTSARIINDNTEPDVFCPDSGDWTEVLKIMQQVLFDQAISSSTFSPFFLTG